MPPSTQPPADALGSPPELLELGRLEADLPRLAEAYRTATPFPHAVLDDVLAPEVLERLVAEHDAVPQRSWTNYLHLNERKFAHRDPAAWGPTLRAVTDALMAPDTIRFLEQLTGIDGLLPDPSMDGGGLHRSHRGGFLNVHADFTAHHGDPGLHRRVNLLLFLNPGWDEGWGGALELWAPDMARPVASIAPNGNRIVVFTTTPESYHGHPEALRCPDDVARRSLAVYYFTADRDVPVRSTRYRARPGDGARRVGIYLDSRALRLYDRAKRRLGLSDGFVSRLTGRLVARRRRG